jgi:diguanylate cyclase (GGDEF)-like protein
VQLAEASRLEKEMLQFRLDATALVRGDKAVTPDAVKLSFDLLWSRVNTEATRITDPRLQNLRKFRPDMARLAAGLVDIDAAVQGLHPGDTEGLARIEAVMQAEAPAMSSMNREAYEELYQKSADTAVTQRKALASLDRVQWVLLIVGFLGFIMLMWQLRRTERLNAALEAREAQIRDLAAVDALTGLANRRYFEERMAAIDTGQWQGEIQTLLIDLDGFKPVNDRHGHAAGDQVLRTVAVRIAAAAGSHKLTARLGGDEFAVVFEGSGQEACRLARTIIGSLSRPIDYEGQLLRVGASIGLARLGDGAAPSAAMLQSADKALYEAKSRGRGRVGCYCAAQGLLCPAADLTVTPLIATAS